MRKYRRIKGKEQENDVEWKEMNKKISRNKRILRRKWKGTKGNESEN